MLIYEWFSEYAYSVHSVQNVCVFFLSGIVFTQFKSIRKVKVFPAEAMALFCHCLFQFVNFRLHFRHMLFSGNWVVCSQYIEDEVYHPGTLPSIRFLLLLFEVEKLRLRKSLIRDFP